MGMILRTPRRTEPYRLRKPRRSSATAQPTQQQAEKRGFARLAWKQPNNELGPCGRRHFRGKTRFTPVLCQKPFISGLLGCLEKWFIPKFSVSVLKECARPS
jgi:hypothetical protein